jgi:hypothetical protein
MAPRSLLALQRLFGVRGPDALQNSAEFLQNTIFAETEWRPQMFNMK